MNEKKLTFPVISSSTFVWDTLKVNGIPQNWIVDAQGVVRLKAIGYDSSEKWEQGMSDALEKNKPAATEASLPKAGGR